MKNELPSPNKILALTLFTALLTGGILIFAVKRFFAAGVVGLGVLMGQAVTFCTQVLGGLSSSQLVWWGIGGILVSWLMYGFYPLIKVIWTQFRLSSLKAKPVGKVKRLLRKLPLDESQVFLLPVQNMAVFCFGLFRPRIYISTNLADKLTDQELWAVLAHETAHLRASDTMRAMAVLCLQRLFFFLPILNNLADKLYLGQELRADNYAVQIAGRRAFLSAVMKLEDSSLVGSLNQTLSLGLNSFLNSRVNHLLEGSIASRPGRSYKFLNLGLSLFVFTILSVLAFWPSHAEVIAKTQSAINYTCQAPLGSRLDTQCCQS